MTEAFGYLRVSGRGQVAGDGFPRQREAIQRHADANGIKIVKWFEERVKGATEWADRPAWVEMVAQFNGVRMIVIERLDRLARDLMVQEHIIADLAKRRITLVSVAEPDLESTDPTRVLVRHMMGAIAQYDKAMIVLKLRAARRRMKTSTGRCEGRKPYGERDGERAIIDRIQAARASGETWTAIAANLNADSIPTRMEGRKQPGAARPRWFGSTVAKIMRRG